MHWDGFCCYGIHCNFVLDETLIAHKNCSYSSSTVTCGCPPGYSNKTGVTCIGNFSILTNFM